MNASPLHKFASLSQRSSRVALGLISGTSMDGIDTALVRIDSSSEPFSIQTLACLHEPYSTAEREALRAFIQCPDLEAMTVWDVYLGERFADTALRLIEQAGAPTVDVIGSHGQTIWHAPRGELFGKPAAGTLQIGQPDVIAARTGLPVVADFRTRDMAWGGQGAPLVPFVDWRLLSHPSENRVALNVGGIANVTLLPAGCEAKEIRALDTGPGNVLIDLATQYFTHGAHAYDAQGAFARKGKVNQHLLDSLLQHPYYIEPTPKSTGREMFGDGYFQTLRTELERLGMLDAIATLTELTARTIARSLSNFSAERLIAAGGGSHNSFLMERLQALLPGVRVESSAAHGIDPDFKEAIAFAVLADCFLRGEPASFPNTTGAQKTVLLGKCCLP
ncbi:MAG: anhydro-N-acetylmuramic acid kinase [Fimbriimonadia bacterium]|nr:anhydro-N-acetylmuramic acid kinase [Fimbriimonadia bacterium]